MANPTYRIPDGAAGKGIKEIEESVGIVQPAVADAPNQTNDEEPIEGEEE